MTRLLSYYGDDFTGSTDVMEAFSSHGVETVLFTRMPTAEEFAPFADHRAIGLAGTSRSQTPEWMDAHLPAAFQWLKALDARFCHYKVCSTFDSSPRIGSIGRALEIGSKVFEQADVTLLVGAPQLKRFTFAGHLFAAFQGQVYRIDRHPVMSRHPVTPMDESDLRVHLARQTAHAFQMIDVHDKVTQLAAGRALLELPGPFLVGSSGVEYALLRALVDRGEIDGQARFEPVPRVHQLLVVSGSVSPTTELQIRYALAHGFEAVAIDPILLAHENNEGEIARGVAAALAVLQKGGSPLVYTAMGSGSDKGHMLDAIEGSRHRLGRALGQIARRCIEQFGLRRVVIAGGDSSSHALAQLDIFALTTRMPLKATPGSPLCVAHSGTAAFSGLEIALKGGQLGGDDYFTRLRDGVSQNA